MRVIQIGIDIAIDDSTDVEVIKQRIINALGNIEVMGIEQSDYGWDYDEYIRENTGYLSNLLPRGETPLS